MEKTFRILKPGDRIYQTIVEDSKINKNALGGAETEFIVKEVTQVDFYKFKLTLNKLKINCSGEFYEDEDTKNRILVITVDGNTSFASFKTKQDDFLKLSINATYYSTTKKELKETVLNIIEEKRKKAEEIKSYSRKISDALWISRMEVNSINTDKEEELEQELDMETIASMAL